MKKKLLILTPIFPPAIGGPATYTAELAGQLKNDYDITIICFSDGAVTTSDTHPLEIPRVKIIPLKIGQRKQSLIESLLGTIKRQYSLFKILKTQIPKTDCVYIQQPMVMGVLGTIMSRYYNKRCLLKFVGDEAWENAFGRHKNQKNLPEFLQQPDADIKTRLLISVQKFVFKKVDTIIVPSRFLKNILTEFYQISPSKIEIIHNAVDTSNHSPKKLKKSQKDLRKVLTIGRLVSWKNIAPIIESLSLLQKKNLELHIIGIGPEHKRLQKLAAQKNLLNQIKFRNRLSHEMVIQELQSADLFILNSLYEGLPHVIIEAMLCNCPVIASAIPGTDEIAINKQTALTCDPKNPHDLAAKIEQILTDPDLSDRLAQNAGLFIKANFSWEKTLKQLKKNLFPSS